MTAEISQDLIFACTEGASGAPLDADVLVDASPRGPELGAQLQERPTPPAEMIPLGGASKTGGRPPGISGNSALAVTCPSAWWRRKSR